MMRNSVVILNAGIGALSMGFERAGFQVTAAYEKDKKAVEIYNINRNDNLSEAALLELVPESLPDADVIVVDICRGMPFTFAKRAGFKDKNDGEELLKVFNIIQSKKPKAVCLVMKKLLYKTPIFSEFLKMIDKLEYTWRYKNANSREMIGFPVTEEFFYMIGIRGISEYGVQFPECIQDTMIDVRDFLESGRVDDWYYRINLGQIEKVGTEDTILCWRRDKYVVKKLVDCNLKKIPLIYTDGEVRKITHREIARLKGFPDHFDFTLKNKEWLYRALVYSPNIYVVEQIAKSISNSLEKTPLKKIQAMNGLQFEGLFGSYLQQKSENEERFQKDISTHVDFIYRGEESKTYFVLKFYNSNFSIKLNLYRECEKLKTVERGEKDHVILVVGNTVSDEIKETCHKNYSIFVWDVRNLLWLFDEFQEIKNEFIALLNYTTDKLEPEKPIPLIFSEHKEALENCSWVERLERLKPGREHYQDYQTLCIDILKYVLGDYLTLWNMQETANNGMYRFDLCCKIKNGANQDFFDTIQRYFGTKYIVFEFKNYSQEITQKEIYTTEKYLYEKALRRVAVIISRMGADDNALAAARGSLRETGKLILCLSDKDLLELIDIKDKNEQPTTDFFEAMLDDLLIHLEK